MIPKERIDYSAIIDRRKLNPPGGARVIVWPIVNVEDWQIDRYMPRQVLPPPTGVTALPDIANWAWHEYGMRVGFWRPKAALDRLGIVPTLSINGSVCLNYPRVAEEAHKSGWGIHGPWLHPDAHAPGRGPARDDQPHGGHHRTVHRQEAGEAGSAPG